MRRTLARSARLSRVEILVPLATDALGFLRPLTELEGSTRPSCTSTTDSVPHVPQRVPAGSLNPALSFNSLTLIFMAVVLGTV